MKHSIRSITGPDVMAAKPKILRDLFPEEPHNLLDLGGGAGRFSDDVLVNVQDKGR